MVCSNCGTQNEAGRKFCKECGTALAVVCGNCGAANSADAKFCGECGNPMAGATAAAVRPLAAAAERDAATVGGAPEPHAERRLVSVLFADLVGFTAIAEGRDPEDTRELLSRYFDLAREVISRHGGTVEKFIGDAVMAVWGAPVAREDDAERAVRAALSLVDAVKGLGPEISARAGVLTGEAAVTIGSTSEGMVAGDLVNTASRLQSVAPVGAVLVGEATERAANQAIQFEPAGEQTLKGKQAPVPAFRALRVVAEVGGRNRTGVLEAPFVGRDDDFRLLKDLFHATGRDKRPRLVSVMGPAGIGKSRLAWEFSKYIDGLVEDTYWHAGRSPSYGEGVTFWALGEMIRRRADLLEGDDDATTRAKIAESVRTWVTDDAQQRWIEPALLSVLGLGDAMPGGRDELFAALRTFFERIAERGPTVLLFEDLQWADSGLLDFIDHLLDWTKSLPIFVMTLSRPELLERRPEWGAGRRNFVSLALEPLPDAAMNDLLDGLAPGLPQQVKRTIIGRADGIPLYAVETVRMLVAQGKLAESDGVYKPVGGLDAIAIPETLTALIAARLDGLEADERAVLQAAAVLGQSFSVQALEVLSGVNEAVLTPMLAAFLRREILSLEADQRSPERGQYSFVQALIREVAYNQLARNERKARHLAAARWFESLGDDELAGVLAEHYAAAHRNAPSGPEADALAGQARIALRGAAERAMALGSLAQAAKFLTQAHELTAEPAEQAALLERAGKALQDIDAEDAEDRFGRAIAIYRSLGDLRGLARSATGISMSLMQRYRPAEAATLLEPIVAETEEIRDEPDGVMLQSELVRAYANSRDPRALGLIDDVLANAERLQLMPIIAEGLINRALILGYAGRFYEPITILRGVLPMTAAHGLNWQRSRALNNLSVLVSGDDLRESDRLIDEAIELSRRTGALGPLRFFKAGQVQLKWCLGQWAEVEEIAAELEDVDATDAGLFELNTSMAIYNAFRGHHEQADELLRRSESLIAEQSLADLVIQFGFIKALVTTLRGDLEGGFKVGHAVADLRNQYLVGYAAEWAARAALWLGDADRARQVAAVGQELTLPGRVLAAQRAVILAAAAALDGRVGEALAGYRQAVDTWRDQDVPVFLGLALTDMAIALGPHPEAVAAAEEARAIWTQLGSPPMLQHLDAGLARWPEQANAGPMADVGERIETPASG